MRTYYEVLGVDEDADTEAIRAAYRERVKETHPDLSDDPDARDRFKRVTQAKEVLTNPTERKRYDRLGHARYVAGAGSGEDPTASRERSGSTDRGSSDRGTSGRRTAGRTTTEGAASGNDYKRRQRERRKWAEFWREQARQREADGDETDRDDDTAGRETGRQKRRWSGQRAGSHQRHRRDVNASGGPDDPWWARSQRFAGAAGQRTGHYTWGPRETTSGTRSTASGTTTGAASESTATTEERTTGYRVTRSTPPGPRFTLGRIGLAAVTFLLYPVFLVSTFLPGFPFVMNVVVGTGTLLLVTYLVARPEAGVLVFGGWTVLAPVALLVSGVGLFSPVGFLLWTACWVPCMLAALNLVFHSS